MAGIALNVQGIMLRPTRSDVCVRQRAAEMALPQFKLWMGSTDGQPDSEFIETLMKVIGGSDGFVIAKNLEDFGYSADAELVSVMDGDFLGDALREMTKQWVTCLGVKLAIPIGAEVDYSGQRGGRGTVVNLGPEVAEYGVRMPGMADNSYRVCAAEKVTLAEGEAA